MTWHEYRKQDPPHRGDYLTWDGEDTEVHYFDGHRFISYPIGLLSEVTHWAELPKPPEEA